MALKSICRQSSLGWLLEESALRPLTKNLSIDLGLLLLHPENEFKFLVKGQIKWADEGPMFRALLRPRCHDLLDKVLDRVSDNQTCFQTAEVDLTADELGNLIGELNAIAVKYGRLSAKTRHIVPARDRQSIGWLMGVVPYATDWKRV